MRSHSAVSLVPVSGKDAAAPAALHTRTYLLSEDRVAAMHWLSVNLRGVGVEWKRAAGSHCGSGAGLALSLHGVT